jgi:hypothetical protein
MLAPVTTVITRAPLHGGSGRAGVRIGLRVAVLGVLLLVLATVHIRSRPATLCTLRAVTGVPCPFCGGTTAATDLGHGDVRAAIAASPLAVLLLALTPVAGAVRQPWWPASRKRRIALVLTVLAAAEVWQLARFGLL